MASIENPEGVSICHTRREMLIGLWQHTKYSIVS